MVIDPNEIKSIEDSMVHDEKDDPRELTGAAVYLTLPFISKVILAVFGVMLLAMLALQVALREGEKMPASLRPESLLFAFPVALVAVYLLVVGEPEPEISKKRTNPGRIVTFIAVFVVMQVVSVVLWMMTAKVFSLH